MLFLLLRNWIDIFFLGFQLNVKQITWRHDNDVLIKWRWIDRPSDMLQHQCQNAALCTWSEHNMTVTIMLLVHIWWCAIELTYSGSDTRRFRLGWRDWIECARTRTHAWIAVHVCVEACVRPRQPANSSRIKHWMKIMSVISCLLLLYKYHGLHVLCSWWWC